MEQFEQERVRDKSQLEILHKLSDDQMRSIKELKLGLLNAQKQLASEERERELQSQSTNTPFKYVQKLKDQLLTKTAMRGRSSSVAVIPTLNTFDLTQSNSYDIENNKGGNSNEQIGSSLQYASLLDFAVPPTPNPITNHVRQHLSYLAQKVAAPRSRAYNQLDHSPVPLHNRKISHASLKQRMTALSTT